MTYADVVQQMRSIQSLLGLLPPATGSVAAATASTAKAASFATALDGATASTAASAAVTGTSGVSTAATASTDGGLVSPNGVTGDDVVDAALDYQGTPYVLGGESRSGIDCSGLVQAAFAKEGVSVPRLVHEQQTIGQRVDSLKDARPGDLIVLNGGDHIAIYMGNDTVIHAPYAGRTVSVQKAWFTDKDITTIRRVVPATDDAAGAASTAATTSSTAGGILGGSALSSASGLSKATILKATDMLTTYGADVGLYSPTDASSASSSGGTSLSSLLASFGLSGTTSGSTTASSSSAQQIIAARQALLGATT